MILKVIVYVALISLMTEVSLCTKQSSLSRNKSFTKEGKSLSLLGNTEEEEKYLLKVITERREKKIKKIEEEIGKRSALEIADKIGNLVFPIKVDKNHCMAILNGLNAELIITVRQYFKEIMDIVTPECLLFVNFYTYDRLASAALIIHERQNKAESDQDKNNKKVEGKMRRTLSQNGNEEGKMRRTLSQNGNGEGTTPGRTSSKKEDKPTERSKVTKSNNFRERTGSPKKGRSVTA